MKIYANGLEVPFELRHESTIGELVTSLLIITNQANKVITKILVDKEELVLGQKEKYCNRPIDGVKQVDIFVENKLQLVLYALNEARNMLPQFTISLGEVAELLMAGQKHKAMNLFGSSLMTWQSIITYLRTVGVSYNLDFKKIPFDTGTIEDKNVELLKTMNELKTAMEREDIVTLGDVIEYELIPKVNEQAQVIAKLEEVVKEADEKVTQDIRSKIQRNAVVAV